MISKTSHRRRFLLTALSSFALVGYSGFQANAQEISEQGLETVILQTGANDEQPMLITSPSDVLVHSLDSHPPSDDPPLQDEPSLAEPVYQSMMPAPVTGHRCASACSVREKRSAATAKMKNAYAGVFYNNDFSYLNDPYYAGPNYLSDHFKRLNTPCGTLDLGGESRYRFHSEHNHRGVGITGRDDDFLLTRNRLYANWQLSDDIRVYGELLDANSNSEYYAPRPIEENDVDIQNLFVDMKWFDGAHGKFTTRLGRQELLYGAQRTASPLDWANTRRTFEGLRGLYENGDTSIDAFWTAYVPVLPKQADYADRDIQFYGAYATQENTALGTLEGYWLGSDDHDLGYSYQTVGNRVSGATNNGTLYDFEGAYQFGEDGTARDHSAGFITAGLGRDLQTKWLSPTVWFYYDWASGEDDFSQVQRADGGYDHLYPLAHKYNGFMDLFGRRNLHDINVFSRTPLSEKVSLIVWYHYFRLDQATTPYSVVMTPYNTANPAQSKDLGHEIDFLLNIDFNPRNNLALGYSHFEAGDYYSKTAIPVAPGRDALNGDYDADFFYMQFTTRY